MSLFSVDYVIRENGISERKSATVSANSKYDAKKVLKRVINQTRVDLADIEIEKVTLLEDNKDGKS